MGIELAEQHGTRLAQAPRHGAIGLGNVILEELGACRRADARGLVEILEADGNAVQGAARRAGGDLLGGAARIGERTLGGDRHVRVDARVQSLDACQIGLGQLERGERAAANRCGRGRHAQIGG